jgi:mono/diheme cytochrome c family protein
MRTVNPANGTLEASDVAAPLRGFQAAVVFATVILLCVVGSAEEDAAKSTAAKGSAFFEKRIQPILKQRCYKCHSHESGKAKGGLVLDSRAGWQTGGSEGPAIVLGKPGESLLLQAVRYESYEMPPKGKLPDDEIALLAKWIAMGAPDPRKSKDPKIDPKKLWALQPIKKPAVPTVKDVKWRRDELDAFILASLEEEGLRPASDADRYTLLRRVTFDLTGLPPTPQEIESFINDQSDRAYENVVDRLLGSPGFGDHWARHWFDLSCYADLADIQGNVLIRDAWRYRDYVIAAFNSDKPLDRFIHEQIAGDLLPYENVAQQRQQIIATGYLAIGPWTLQNYIKGQLDADVVDHQIDRIGRTFLAQTISCARCHDHKFDPVPTRDYYALAGIFHSTRTTSYDGPGVWSQITHIDLPKPEVSPEQLARREHTLKDLKSQQQKLQAELTSLILRIPGASTANVLTLAEGIAANEKGRDYEVGFEAAPTVWAGASQQTKAADGLQIDILRADGSNVAGFRHNPGPWLGTKDAQKLHHTKFTYRGDGSGDVRIRVTSATPGSGRFGGALDDLSITTAGKVIHEENFNQLKPNTIEGLQANTKLRVLAGATVPGWVGGGINNSHAVDLGNGNFALQLFGGSAGSLASAKPVAEAGKRALPRALKLEKEVQGLTARISELDQKAAPEKALAVRDIDSPADGRIYQRGSFQSLGDTVPRGFLSSVPVAQRHDIPTGTSGRLQLAHWLTDAGNPLTSRVLVNRIWHHLFGKGLVRSVDYFGVHGETPSHPELLDFLAVRLREDDRWSLKTTVRRMVMSRTYRMASSHNSRGSKVDPDNRLLWQMPRRRLTAESIRDAMLAVSGEIDPGRGGPCLGLELKGNILGAGGNVNPANWGGKIPDDIKNRRSVYLPLKRERPVGELEILSVFDFPHPSEITGARPNTTVATQALFLLNAPFVKHQANKLAERLAKEEPKDEQARVNRLYLLTVSRPADAAEIETALVFLDQSTRDLASNSGPEKARAIAWTQLCHAILGSNSFLFRE